MDKYDKHMEICKELNRIYRDKNHDYGDSFGETFEKLGIISAVTRITDKVNRLQSLCTKEQKVEDESIIDTLKDLANYAIMTLIELDSDAIWLFMRSKKGELKMDKINWIVNVYMDAEGERKCIESIEFKDSFENAMRYYSKNKSKEREDGRYLELKPYKS